MLWFFLGGIGGHRYYLGKIGTGILMTITLGCLGIWTLIDLFLLSGMIRKTNSEIEQKIIEEIRVVKNAQKMTQLFNTYKPFSYERGFSHVIIFIVLVEKWIFQEHFLEWTFIFDWEFTSRRFVVTFLMNNGVDDVEEDFFV
ncbi:TM2 domain-containing protein [Parageobacillus toebii]|nr:TM2 domain-containing protein [Parageobacillus toebii]